ncbi:hypothetical protein LCGC14_2158860 [marine sediment metagenome]|uniref:LamG-like jellyroll fold domain-containing protein n=1 Tax=marine sediment metagenome TaxID=412755 RepID=A0A0F9EFL3_9ZZZZ
MWDSNYKAVWHLKESGNGTVGEYKDSTANNNHGQGGGGTSTMAPAQTASGKMGNAQSFDGADDYISIPDHASLGLDSYTVEGWINGTTGTPTGPNGAIAYKLGPDYGITFEPDDMWVYTDNGAAGWNWNTNINLTVGWHYVAVTFNGTTRRAYIDGSLQASSDAVGTISNSNMEVNIGKNTWTGSTDGYIDEVLISSTDRSADWVQTTYNNQLNASGSINVGGEEGQSFSITGWSLAPDNSYVDVTFTEGVYTAGGINPVVAGDFGYDFMINNGIATGITINSVTKAGGGALTGGETTVWVYITIMFYSYRGHSR